MRDVGFRRRRWTYSFRAWIGDEGFNEDRNHAGVHACNHIRLWNVCRTSNHHNIVQVTRRRHPFHFSLRVGSKYRGFAFDKKALTRRRLYPNR